MAKLDEQYRRSQRQVAARTTRDLLGLWPIWATGDRESWARFAAAARKVILQRGAESAALSRQYYAGKRLMVLGLDEAPAAPFELPAAPEDGRLNASLEATGVGGTLRAMRMGMKFEAARKHGFVMMSRAAERHVLNAGRETLVRTAEADPLSIGYKRHIEGTCSFCSSLSGDVVTNGRFKAHDGCKCSAEPMFGSPPVEPVGGEVATTPNAWFKSLTRDEFNAGEYYKGAGYKQMNGALRGKMKMSELMEKRAKLLDSALQKGALGKDTTLFRMAPADAFGQLKVGAEFADHGFISTSLKRAFAGDYRHKKATQIFEIAGKAGQRGGYADQLWRTGKNLDFLNPSLKENEFILPRGTKFRVVRVWQGNDGMQHVALEVVSG